MRQMMLWCAFSVLLTAPTAWAEEWPQFRGTDANGLTTETNLPLEWGADKNVKWTFDVPGRGWSSPIVWGDKVFVTTAVREGEGTSESGERERQSRFQPGGGRGRDRGSPNEVYRWEIYCIDHSTGKLLWKRVAHQGKPRIPTHRSNTYASETPVTDGERVYAYFGMTGLFCYDFNGKLVWKKDLGAYPMQSGWGTSSSPALHDGLLFLQIDNEKQSFLVALDAQTGDERWRVSREERSTWSSPIIWKNKARTELVTSGRTVRSYDPGNGELLWELKMGGGRASASAAGNDELLFVGTEDRSGRRRFGGGNRGGNDEGGGGALFAVKAGASGDITPAEGKSTSAGVLWSRPKAGPSMASPLIYQGHVYILDRRNGMVSCYDAKTGKPAYEKERLLGARAFWASPWAYDGKVFCLDDSGTTHVLAAGPTFQEVTRNKLNGQFWATTAIADGTLIFRGADKLYCIKQ